MNRNSPFELKRLNIIVGANNAGKSRFMREFIFKLKVNSVDFKYPQAYKDYISIINSFICNHSSKHQLEIPDNSLYSLEDIVRQWQNIGSFLTDTRKAIEAHITYRTSPIKYNTLEYAIVTGKLPHEVRELIDDINQLIEGLSNIKNTLDSLSFKALKFYYIDSLRSLRKLNSQITSTDAESEYYPLLSRTITDYSFEKDEIISGEDFFGLLTDSLLGKPDERQRIQSYQEKLSHYFFNNEVITIIPHLRTDSIEIKIGEAEQFPISKLGDGLQQVIILTYKAFLTTEPSFFFIEEPEMHLHAGYVKQLMKFLLNETDHYYMATSHSNYLLDMINEDKRIALYRVDKEQMNDEENKYETVIKRCDGDRTILQTLGVSPSSVFLANCTIWIEGITDRLYFVQYLKKYLEELKTTDEDKWKDYSRFIDGYHYAFVEYQGSNLDHWDFSIESPVSVDSSQNKGLSALLVTSNALVVADSDLQGKPRFDELKEQLGDNMIITLGKETENTLPKKLLVKRFYQKCPQNAVAVKGNTTKITHKDEHDRYFDDNYLESDKGVGMYLDDVIARMRENEVFPSLEGEQESFTFSDKGKQGTVKSKTDFCHAIVELMQTEVWQLTKPAEDLCEAIFQHIKNNNH